MSNKKSETELPADIYLACMFSRCGQYGGKYGIFSIMYNYAQELLMRSMYHMKGLYMGETPVLYKKAIAYSPIFWILQTCTLLMIVCFSPFVLGFCYICSIKRELKGQHTKAKDQWEKDYVSQRAAPPNNFDI